MNNQPRGELVPGGLAMVIGCVKNPINIGKIVTTENLVMRGHISPDGIPYDDDMAWFCTAPDLFVMRNREKMVKTGYSYTGADHLLPIHPSADPLEISQQQECEV